MTQGERVAVFGVGLLLVIVGHKLMTDATTKR